MLSLRFAAPSVTPRPRDRPLTVRAGQQVRGGRRTGSCVMMARLWGDFAALLFGPRPLVHGRLVSRARCGRAGGSRVHRVGEPWPHAGQPVDGPAHPTSALIPTAGPLLPALPLEHQHPDGPLAPGRHRSSIHYLASRCGTPLLLPAGDCCRAAARVSVSHGSGISHGPSLSIPLRSSLRSPLPFPFPQAPPPLPWMRPPRHAPRRRLSAAPWRAS